MTRLTAADFDQELLVLFDAYVHGDLDRRGFLEKARRFAVGGMTAAGILASLSPQFAAARVVAEDDARLKIDRVTFDSPQGNGKVQAYVARPAQGNGPWPAVMVVHENRGLNPHIEDVARRLALEGFLAFAPDALTTLGGYPGDEDKARALFAKLDQGRTQEDFVAAAKVLAQRSDVKGPIGVTGFCYGGGIAHMLSVRVPGLGAAVPFYGNLPLVEDAEMVTSPLMIHFADKDDRINARWPEYEAALKKAKIPHIAYSYPGTQHGFHNDTTPRFDEEAAKLAWERTLAFLRQHLKAA